MTDLDPLEEELLSAFRQARDLDPAAHRRVWARLHHRATAEPPGLGTRHKWVILTGVSIAAALLGWLLGSVGPRASTGVSDESDVFSASDERVPTSPGDRYRVKARSEARADTATTRPASRSTPARSSERAPASISREPEAMDASLRAEMELLLRAEGALGQGDDAEARRVLDDHRTRFPAGQMAEDREAFTVRLRCRTEGSSGPSVLAEFMQRFPGSGHRTTLEKACR